MHCQFFGGILQIAMNVYVPYTHIYGFMPLHGLILNSLFLRKEKNISVICSPIPKLNSYFLKEKKKKTKLKANEIRDCLNQRQFKCTHFFSWNLQLYSTFAVQRLPVG